MSYLISVFTPAAMLVFLSSCAPRAVSDAPALEMASYATAQSLQQRYEFSCPAPGTTLVVNGIQIVYVGNAQGDPFVCVRRQGSRTVRRLLGNFWGLPTPDDQAIRRGLTQLWPLGVGKVISYDFRFFEFDELRPVRHTFRVIGEQQKFIATRNRLVIVIE